MLKVLIIFIALLVPPASMADCCCRKIVDYVCAYATTFGNIDKKVQELISKGYQPLGGISLNNNGSMAQAMVKYEE